MIECTILKSSDSATQSGMFENHNQTIELHVRDCGDEPILTSAFLVEEFLADINKSYGVVAVTGTAFKFRDGDTWALYTPNTEFGEWRVRSVQVRPDSDKHTYRVSVTQTNMGMQYNTDGSGTLFGVPSVTVNKLTRTRSVNAWRVGGEVGTETVGEAYDDGSPDKGWGALYNNCPSDWVMCNTTDDMGGTPIDINGGNPTQYNVGQEQITLEWLVRSPYVDAFDETKNDAQWTNLYWLQNMVNTRNAEEWFGFAPGYLLVTDVAIQPIHHEFKRVTMTMIYDSWKHANQRPWVTSAGVVASENACSIDPPDEGINLVNFVARTVGWLQPYQQLGSFGTDPGDLFPQYVWDDAWLKLGGTNADGYAPAIAEGCE